MTGHLHINFLQALIDFLAFIPFIIIWRMLALKWADTQVGKTMLAIV